MRAAVLPAIGAPFELREVADPEPQEGQALATVLVHAAAGGVGTAAVQVARALGARVVAAAVSRLRPLGQPVAIGYAGELRPVLDPAQLAGRKRRQGRPPAVRALFTGGRGGIGTAIVAALGARGIRLNVICPGFPGVPGLR